MRLTENLDFLISSKKMTSKKLSYLIKVPLPTINRLRSDTHINPTISSLLPICEYFKVSLDQLLGREPLPVGDTQKFNPSPMNKISVFKWSDIPYFVENKFLNTNSFTNTELQGNCIYALKVEVSNWNEFEKGSLIIFNTERKPSHGDYVIVLSLKDKLVGIRQFLVDIDAVYLKSLNDNSSTLKVDDQYHIVGVILQVKRDLIIEQN